MSLSWHDLVRFRTLAVLLLSPVLAAAVAWFGTSAWSASAHRAATTFDLAPLIGTYAGYDVATHSSDFALAYDEGRSTSETAADLDEPGALAQSDRVGGSTQVRLTYVADSAKDAERGLRASASRAVAHLSDGFLAQKENAYRGAQEAYSALLTSPPSGAKGKAAAQEDPAVVRAAQNLADAMGAFRTAQVARGDAEQAVARARVSIEPVSTTSQRTRATAVAALTGFLAAAAILYVLSRRRVADAPSPARVPVDFR